MFAIRFPGQVGFDYLVGSFTYFCGLYTINHPVLKVDVSDEMKALDGIGVAQL
jgi:hypothetical protein